MIKENFIKLYENSFRENWDLPCYTDYGEDTQYTYGEVAEKIARLHLLFKHCSLRRGDKISVIGKNNAHWCIAYMATITYGAIIVPILQDFTPNDVHHIVNHSESVFLFTSDSIWENLEEEKLTGLRGVFSLTDFRCLYQRDGETIQKFLKNTDKEMHALYPKGFTREDVQYTTLSNDKVMLLNYTSGTTGFSKGVMLTGNNLAGNVTFGIRTELLKKGDKVLSFLPLAHAYGCAFDFLTATAVGTHVTLLGKTPSPKIIMKAFEEVKPSLIVAVPLIIEKIIKKSVLPKLETPAMKILLKVPIINDKIKATVREEMIKAFGGNFKAVIVGGAAFNQEVEQFLKMIDFPYTVGYGMTECGPIICYEDWRRFKPGSCGKAVPRMDVKVLSSDPENIVGEIVCKGPNVMLGYYKNEEATQEVIDKDGWLHTGDLALMDAEGNVTIKGRSKNLLLSASGQNIYPEEIEDKLNNLPYVAESIIVQQNEKLVGLVYPDFDDAFAHGLKNEDIEQIMEENRVALNDTLPAYSQISKMKIYPEEFEKTPKKSIKRYLYQEAKG